MAKTVRLKVASSGAVKPMNEESAKRLVLINPKEYTILEEPKVEVLNLPPITGAQPEKKSVVVAEVENKEAEEKRKPGRPKQNA